MHTTEFSVVCQRQLAKLASCHKAHIGLSFYALVLQGLNASHFAAQYGRVDHVRQLMFDPPDIDARSTTVRCCTLYANQWHAKCCHLEPKGSGVLLHAYGQESYHDGCDTCTASNN